MVIDKGTRPIETPRLLLRRFELSDAQQMFDNWANNAAVCRFLPWPPHGTISVTQSLVKNWVDAYESDDRYHWAMVLKSTTQVVGSISVSQMWPKNACCELGYCMSEQYWGQGLTTEAVQAVIAYLLQEVGMHRIQAHHDTQNPASGRVMEKSGMQMEGTLRHSRMRDDGTFADWNIWAIVADA